jgi:hypothetical protein
MARNHTQCHDKKNMWYRITHVLSCHELLVNAHCGPIVTHVSHGTRGSVVYPYPPSGVRYASVHPSPTAYLCKRNGRGREKDVVKKGAIN